MLNYNFISIPVMWLSGRDDLWSQLKTCHHKCYGGALQIEAVLIEWGTGLWLTGNGRLISNGVRKTVHRPITIIN